MLLNAYFYQLCPTNKFVFQGGRETDDFIKYIAKHATKELRGWDRSGAPKDLKEL
jgi:protein disulfide isomerase family A protein 3